MLSTTKCRNPTISIYYNSIISITYTYSYETTANTEPIIYYTCTLYFNVDT